jgi:hypothetical protein
VFLFDAVKLHREAGAFQALKHDDAQGILTVFTCAGTPSALRSFTQDTPLAPEKSCD